MTNDEKLMQQALNCLTVFGEDIKSMTPDEYEVIAALRARLAQPEREWQGLTGKEVNHLLAANVDCAEKLIRAIEAKLKEKNSG